MAKRASDPAGDLLADIFGGRPKPKKAKSKTDPGVAHPDPFADVTWTRHSEKDDAAESAAVLRYLTGCPAPAYSAATLVFVSCDQNYTFLQAAGWAAAALDYRPVYLDGYKVAAILGHPLPLHGACPFPAHTGPKLLDTWKPLAQNNSAARRVKIDIRRNVNPNYYCTLVFRPGDAGRFAALAGWTAHALAADPDAYDGIAIASLLGRPVEPTTASLLTRGRRPDMWKETGVVPPPRR